MHWAEPQLNMRWKVRIQLCLRLCVNRVILSVGDRQGAAVGSGQCRKDDAHGVHYRRRIWDNQGLQGVPLPLIQGEDYPPIKWIAGLRNLANARVEKKTPALNLD